MNFQRALVVEDYPQAVFVLRPLLRSCNFLTDHARTVDAAVTKLHHTNYDLVILDRNLPDGDGIELLSVIEEQSLDTKTLVLSERGRVEERVDGLQKGADDYLPKPFSSEEFIARVYAIMRRARKLTFAETQIGPCALSVHEALLEYNTQTIQLSKKEAKIIDLFARHPKHVLQRERIATSLWTVDKYPSTSSIDTFMKRLRNKLSSTPLQIRTRYNLGYELLVQK